MRVELPAAPANIVVESAPLESQPFDEKAWRERTILAVLGAGPATSTVGATVTGFPMETVESDTAIVALYGFLDHVGVAVARAADAGALAAARDEVLMFLRQARPDWRGAEVACLKELWES